MATIKRLPVQIYRASAEDKQGLARICEEWGAEEFWSYEEFLISMRIPGTFLHYQSEGGKWLSLALGRAGGGCVELFYIYVSVHARRQGLAEQILEEFCVVARDWSADLVSLEVKPSNEAAKQLYEKLGFKRVAIRKRYYQNNEDAWIYEKAVMEPSDS